MSYSLLLSSTFFCGIVRDQRSRRETTAGVMRYSALPVRSWASLQAEREAMLVPRRTCSLSWTLALACQWVARVSPKAVGPVNHHARGDTGMNYREAGERESLRFFRTSSANRLGNACSPGNSFPALRRPAGRAPTCFWY